MHGVMRILIVLNRTRRRSIKVVFHAVLLSMARRNHHHARYIAFKEYEQASGTSPIERPSPISPLRAPHLPSPLVMRSLVNLVFPNLIGFIFPLTKAYGLIDPFTAALARVCILAPFWSGPGVANLWVWWMAAAMFDFGISFAEFLLDHVKDAREASLNQGRIGPPPFRVVGRVYVRGQ